MKTSANILMMSFQMSTIFFLEYWTISSIRAFINNNFCEFRIKFAQESQQQYVFRYEINETASNSLDFGRNIWKTSILKIINFFIPFIHVLQQFRLVSQIWRIWKFWIWPTITSKNCRCQFHQCPNFAFWICQSIDSLHCLGDLVPSQFLKYSIYHTITWAKTLCPETFSWWVRYGFTRQTLRSTNTNCYCHSQKLFVPCIWVTMNSSIFRLVLGIWRICKSWVEHLKSSTNGSIIWQRIFLFIQLGLRDNQLVELPREIGELARLRELHIQNNRLTVLPPEVGEFQSK